MAVNEAKRALSENEPAPSSFSSDLLEEHLAGELAPFAVPLLLRALVVHGRTNELNDAIMRISSQRSRPAWFWERVCTEALLESSDMEVRATAYHALVKLVDVPEIPTLDAADLRHNLAVAAESLGRVQDAQRWLKEALDLNTELEPAQELAKRLGKDSRPPQKPRA